MRDFVRLTLLFLGAAVIIVSAALVLGGYVRTLPYLSDAGSATLSVFGLWLIVLPALGIVAVLGAARRGRAATSITALGVLTVLGAGIAVAQMVHAANDAGASIDLVKAFGVSKLSPAPVDATVAYTRTRQNSLELAIYRPRRSGHPAPVLVYVHGGGWIAGSRLDRGQDMRWFADHGWLTISVDYTLSSKQLHLWNQTIREIGCALTWVARNSGRYGGDAARLSLFGDSAGGNLVINAGYMANQGTLPSSCGGTIPRVAAVVAMYPAVDVAASQDNTDALLGGFARYLTAAYTGGTPRQFPDRYAAVSSATHISRAAPPTLIIVGTNDHLVQPEGAYAFADRARAAGVEVRLVRFPFGEHGFDAIDGGIGDQLARQATSNFLTALGEAP